MVDRCRVCGDDLSDEPRMYDVHPECYSTYRAQFYDVLHRYRRRHPHDRQG